LPRLRFVSRDGGIEMTNTQELLILRYFLV